MELNRRLLPLSVVALLAGPVLSQQPRPPSQPMFSAGQGYEKFMGRWSRRLAPQFLKFAGLQDGGAVLDVGSGTGSLSLALQSALPHAEIVGIDPSQAYVEYARSRTEITRVKFEVADAQRLPFPDASFTASVSLLVINFIPDSRRALAEMRRVTKPGGTVAACVWDYERVEMLRAFWDEAVALNPAAEPRHERHMPYGRRGELQRLWTAAGFEQVQETELTLRMNFESFDDLWTPFLEGQGPAGAYVLSLPPEDRATLLARVRQKLAPGAPDRPFSIQALARAVRGKVPVR